MLKKFVRSAKYIKMSAFSCILIWDINFENLIISLKAAIVFLNTTEHRKFYHWAQKILSRDGVAVVAE